MKFNTFWKDVLNFSSPNNIEERKFHVGRKCFGRYEIEKHGPKKFCVWAIFMDNYLNSVGETFEKLTSARDFGRSAVEYEWDKFLEEIFDK